MSKSETVVYLVMEVRFGSATPLRAFETRENAEAWRDDHVTQFERLPEDDSFEYHVGMGGKAGFNIKRVPYGENNAQ
jgi:hypothetical protein